MIAVQSQTETRRGGPVPGLDQPCSRNPTAALPLVGSDPYVPCTPCGERGATGWGTRVRFNFEVAEWVQVPHNTGHRSGTRLCCESLSGVLRPLHGGVCVSPNP